MTPERKRTKKAEKLIQDYSRLYGGVGALLYPFNPDVAQLYLLSAETRAQELIDMASHHPKLLAWLERGVKGSDYTTFIIGHGTLVYAALQGFGVAPSLSSILARVRERFTPAPVSTESSAASPPPVFDGPPMTQSAPGVFTMADVFPDHVGAQHTEFDPFASPHV